MKKILALALCLIFITCFIPTLSLAQGETYYCNESFSSALNTDAGTKPYWQIEQGGNSTVTVGTDPKDSSNQCLIINKTDSNTTQATVRFDDAVAAPYVVVEGRIMFKYVGSRRDANIFRLFGGSASNGRLMTSQLYGANVITASNGTNVLYTATAETWTKIKYVIDTTKTPHTYDVYVNDVYVKTTTDNQTGASSIVANPANSMTFNVTAADGNTLYLDDLKVYTTAAYTRHAGASFEFADMSGVTGTGTVAVVGDPANANNNVLKVENANSKATLTFDAVQATDDPDGKIVVKTRLRNSANNFYIRLFDSSSTDYRVQIQGYGGYLKADHYNNGYNNGYAVSNITTYNTNKWYDLTIVVDTKTNATHTFDVYVDGEKKLSSLIPRGTINNINKIELWKANTHAGTLYVDDVKIFNPEGGQFVTDIELVTNAELYIPVGETAKYPLALSIKNDDGAAVSNAYVTWALTESKAGVSVNGGYLTVSSSATAGTVGLEATVTVDGISYKKEFVLNLVDTYTFTDAVFAQDGNTLNISFNAAKNADAAAQPTFIVAVFEGEVLKSTIVKNDVTLTKNSQLVNIPVALDSASNVTVKLFKWNLGTLIPCDGVESFPR